MSIIYEVRNTVTIRTGPGSNFKAIDRLVRGDEVEVIFRRDGFSQLPSGRWVSSEYLKLKSLGNIHSDGRQASVNPPSVRNQFECIERANCVYLPPDHDWREVSNYIDNYETAFFNISEPSARRFYVVFRGGERIYLRYENVVQQDENMSFGFAMFRLMADGKIYPNMFCRATTPRLVEHARMIEDRINQIGEDQETLGQIVLSSAVGLRPAAGSLQVRVTSEQVRNASRDFARLVKDQRGGVTIRLPGQRRLPSGQRVVTSIPRLNRHRLNSEERTALNDILALLNSRKTPSNSWGTPFENKEGLLPSISGQRMYREYRVAPTPQNPNATRVVAETDLSGTRVFRRYYTRSHYGDNEGITDVPFYRIDP